MKTLLKVEAEPKTNKSRPTNRQGFELSSQMRVHGLRLPLFFPTIALTVQTEHGKDRQSLPFS